MRAQGRASAPAWATALLSIFAGLLLAQQISADATEADVLHPRTVFCTRGGLFTGLRVRDSVEANPAGSSVGLDVCCTTSVFVEGFGDFGDSCVQLGNVTVEEPAEVLWGKGELCNRTSVVSDVVVENAGAGTAAYIESLFVYCVDRTSDADNVVDHLSVAFSPSGIDYIGTFQRTVPPAPMPITLTAALNISAANGARVRVRPIETFESCATEVAGDGGQGDGRDAADNEWVFFATDLQCQGVRHDRCTCVGGAVECVFGTTTGPLVARDMVTEGDLLHMKEGGTPGWCEDGDPVHRWMLIAASQFVCTYNTMVSSSAQEFSIVMHLQDTKSGNCKALPAGQKELINLPCSSSVAAQRWRPASYQGELASGAVLQDSRLESATNPGLCVMLQNNIKGGLQPVVGSCYAADLVSSNTNVPSTGGEVLGTDGAVYAASLALVPLKSATGDWYSDYTTVADASEALGGALKETFESIEEAAVLANTAGFAGRARHNMPHCMKHGIICNAMGRVVYYSVQGTKNVTTEASEWKIPGVDSVVLDIMQLPWLVNIHLEGSSVEGRLPDLQELVSLPAMLRTANFAQTNTTGTLPTGLEELALLTELNLSNTLISGPIPSSLLMPAMAPKTAITPLSMVVSSFLTLDVSGVPDGDTPLCAPYNLTLSDAPSRMRIVKGGQPFDIPVCEQYVEWTITLSEDAACAMTVVCNPEHQKPYIAHVNADAPVSNNTDTDAPTLRERSQTASNPGQSVAELACSASCAEDDPSESSTEELLEAVTVNVIMTPPAPEDLIAARSHAIPDEGAAAPEATDATAVGPVPPPLLATAARRRLAGVNEWATMIGNRRLLLPALVDLPPTKYRHHIGSLKALGVSVRRLQQQSGVTTTQMPVVKFVTVGLAPSADAGSTLLTTMFSDVLTPADISAASIEWQGGEELEADAAAAAAAAGGTTSGAPGVDVIGTSGDSGSAGGQSGDSITSSEVTQSTKDNNALPRTALIVIFTLVALLFVILVLLGFWRWRISMASSVGDGKSSSYLSAGVPMIQEDGDSVMSNYSRITPASDEYTVTQLGSVSMSVNGVREPAQDGSQQTIAGGGAKSVAGNNSRRPLWMQLDNSGSVRSLLQSRGRSKSRQISDSGAVSYSDALTHNIVPGRSKYMAGEFAKGSPVKALLRNEEEYGGVNDKLPPVSGSWNCESDMEPQGTFSRISASVDAKERDAMTTLTAPSSLRSSVQPATTAAADEDQEKLANGTSGQLTCKSSLQTFSVRRSTECMYYEATGDEEVDSICVGLPGYDSVPLTATKQVRSGHGSGGGLGSMSQSITRDMLNSTVNGTQFTTAHSTANGTAIFDTTSHAGTSSRVEGSQIRTPPHRTRSPAFGYAAENNIQNNIHLLHATPPPVLTPKAAASPAQALSGDEEAEEEHAMFNSTTTPPEGGYVRSLVRNLPWRSPQITAPGPSSSELVLTPQSCPLQVSPCPADAPTSASSKGRKCAGRSAPFAIVPASSTIPVPAYNSKTDAHHSGACNKVTSWLEDAPTGSIAVPSSSESASIEANSIPYMLSGTTQRTQSQLCSKVTEYTQQQEQDYRNEQSSSRFQSQVVTAPAHCLESEIHITALSMPAGNVLETEDRGPVILDSATGQPCTVMRMLSESSNAVTARVIICTYTEQCAAIEERADVCDVCPPILRLQVPVGFSDGESTATNSSTLRSAPAVCFACTETLAEEIESGTSRASPEAAGLLLASLCALLERLHIAGYTAGGLTPDIVVRPSPCGRPGDWKLLCAHSVLQQGSTAEPVAPLNIRWCAPEQMMFARATGGAFATTGMLGSMQQSGSVGSKGEKRASHVNTPTLAIADVASDMFSLGLILYNAVTGCDYWGDFTDDQVAEALAGEIPMPHLSCGPAHEHPAAALVLPLISPLLTRSAPARPLASETLAAVNERFPGVLKQVVMRTSIPRSPLDHIRYPDSKPPVRATSNTQPVTMRFMLAQRGADGQVQRTISAQRVNHKWVFPVSRGAQYQMVVCIELADNAPVSVFPMESASHVVVEASNASAPSGSNSQTLEIQSADAYYAGRGVLLLVPWDPSELLRDASMQELRMHLFTKVVGFSELIKISKRVHINVTDVKGHGRSKPGSSEPLQVPLDVVQSAREGGIHFEAHIPLSKQVLEG